MMLTASWHMLTMTKTHPKTNTKTKTTKVENFQEEMFREGIVTLCCNISIQISYMRLHLKRQRQRQDTSDKSDPSEFCTVYYV